MLLSIGGQFLILYISTNNVLILCEIQRYVDVLL